MRFFLIFFFRCAWEILAPENHKITLNFTHFDLEGNAFYQPAACEYDAGSIFIYLCVCFETFHIILLN